MSRYVTVVVSSMYNVQICDCCGVQYEHGDEQTLAAVVKMMPNKVKRRRKIQTEAGVSKRSYLVELCIMC